MYHFMKLDLHACIAQFVLVLSMSSADFVVM